MASPFSLPWGSSIFAKVSASNLYGDSAFSSAGNGAKIVTFADAPLNLVNVPAVTTAYQAGLSWNIGANSGGTPVIDYRVIYDQGTNNWAILSAGIVLTSYTSTLRLQIQQLHSFQWLNHTIRDSL